MKKNIIGRQHKYPSLHKALRLTLRGGGIRQDSGGGGGSVIGRYSFSWPHTALTHKLYYIINVCADYETGA